MTVDHYARSGRRWALGSSLVYGPIAAELVGWSPHPLSGRTVLDAGAGTGAVTAALSASGARAVASDLSRDMLAWDSGSRPPAVVADVRSLPFADACFDDAVAAFVLNHLVQPSAGLHELVRVTRPGGAVLATVFSNASRSVVRERIDELARSAGWVTPSWYTDIKSAATPLLGTAAAMNAALCAAGLVDVCTDERPVEVGVDTAADLVAYRLGQAHFASWLDGLGEERAVAIHRSIADAVAPIMQAYRPIVVFGRGLRAA